MEYLLIPLAFGFGAPLVAMVGTCIGAADTARAAHVAWVGAGITFALTEAIGVTAAVWPRAWLELFGRDPGMLAAGTAMGEVEALRLMTNGPDPPRRGASGNGPSQSSTLRFAMSAVGGVAMAAHKWLKIGAMMDKRTNRNRDGSLRGRPTRCLPRRRRPERPGCRRWLSRSRPAGRI